MSIVPFRRVVLRALVALTVSLAAPPFGSGVAFACGWYGDPVSAEERAAIEEAVQRHFVVRYDSPAVSVGYLMIEGETASGWVSIEGEPGLLVELTRVGAGWHVTSPAG